MTRPRASMRWVVGLSLVACHLSLVTAVEAAVPRTIHYQGKLTDSDGTPLVGEHTVILRLYDAATGGSQLWQEEHTINLDRTDNGIFSVILGSVTPFGATITFNEPLWLTTEVDGTGEFSPRQPLSAVGYAINADTLDGLDASQLVQADTLIGTAQLQDGAVTSVKLAADSVGPNALSAAAIQPGDIEVGDLPAHATRHQPGGSDALPTAGAVGVGSTNAEGASTSLARADHVHEGLHSLAVSGQPPLVGDAVLAAGSNVTLSQAGQTITIAASGAGASGGRVSATASNAIAIGAGADTTLLSVSVTKTQASSALLILASVQLTHTDNPSDKTVDVKLFRDSAQLDATYVARLGIGARAVSELPVTLHVWDAPAAGTYTISLRARSSGAGAQASIRRLTVVEIP